MRPESMTPDLLLDGVGYRLEHGAELEVWLLLRPYRGIQFLNLTHTHARLAEAIALPPARTRRPVVSLQLTFGWDLGSHREEASCDTI
jgi:hypothetical protein